MPGFCYAANDSTIMTARISKMIPMIPNIFFFIQAASVKFLFIVLFRETDCHASVSTGSQ